VSIESNPNSKPDPMARIAALGGIKPAIERVKAGKAFKEANQQVAETRPNLIAELQASIRE
jgi:hypothetical protein